MHEIDYIVYSHSMRLVTYEIEAEDGARPRVGALSGPNVVELPFDDMLALLQGGPEGMAAARAAAGEARSTVAVEDVRLLPPLLRPNSLRLFSLGEEHLLNAIAQIASGAVPGVEEMALPKLPQEWYEIPAYYKGNPDEIYGPDATVPWPAYTDKLDFELEIAAVIGTEGRRIPVEEASAYIAGYTILNDWSARDLQQREMRVNLGPGICKDFANGLGPCIATPEEFDRDTATLEVRVDGETWATSHLEMQFSFEEVIAWVSQEQTLNPGDILSSGTVARGAGVELDRWVSEGAAVELEAEGIGILTNIVGRKGGSVPLPPSQRARAARQA
jgi:2-keto-4-pentenoate hydratase/2-oxohepta-3-ene-1,7-dioic acid hydratase in catechol pathway